MLFESPGPPLAVQALREGEQRGTTNEGEQRLYGRGPADTLRKGQARALPTGRAAAQPKWAGQVLPDLESADNTEGGSGVHHRKGRAQTLSDGQSAGVTGGRGRALRERVERGGRGAGGG